MTKDQIYKKAIEENPNSGSLEIAKLIKKNNPQLKIGINSIRRRVQEYAQFHDISLEPVYELKDTTTDRGKMKEEIKKFLSKPKTIIEISNKFEKPPKEIEKLLDELRSEKFNVVLTEDGFELSNKLKQGGHSYIDLSRFENKVYKFGFTTDNHLCSKYERLDILNALYDIYESEGITEVFQAGNIIDGVAQFNKYDVHVTGVTPQIDYLLANYPKRNGIKTKFIAGDDHEGWFVQREKVNIGEYIELKAKENNRDDLEYLGYIEADVVFKSSRGKAIMKVMHPGGGSAYALSYSPQKIVESFTGGEKPSILLLGHYHKADYLPSYRNVHVIQGGTTQDQTPFMRKKKIQAHLGGWIIEFQQSKDGAINRFKTEFISFFDKHYYKKQGYYR